MRWVVEPCLPVTCDVMNMEGDEPEMAEVLQEGDLPFEGSGTDALGQDEGVNTIEDGANEPDVISTYTVAQPQDVDQAIEQEEGHEQAEEPAVDAEADEFTPGEDAPAVGSRPGSSAGPVRSASIHSQAAPAPPSRSASIHSQAAPSRSASIQAQAEPQTTGSRPGSSVPLEGSRPATAEVLVDTPTASSRPASGVLQDAVLAGSRPASAVPAENATVGSRPASSTSAVPPAAGSRPATAAAEVPAVLDSGPGSGAIEPAVAGSRPTSSASAAAPPTASSRPASSSAAAAPAPAAPSSHPGSSALPAVVGSRPGSTQTAAAPTPETKPPSAQVSRPGSQPTTTAQASGSSRPASALTPGADVADARPSSAALKAQAAEDAGFAIPGMRAIDVAVDQGPGLPNRMLRVYMDYTQTDTKSFLGGYRNKRSGATYHHACTQTPKAPKYAGAQPKLERQTQTVKVSTRSQQAVREASTQMERPGLTLDTTYDREVTPGRYQTSEERLGIVTDATRCVQRWMRGYFGRKRAMYLWGKKMERESFLQDQEVKAQQVAEEHRRREIERRMHPRTAADFEILYNELEAWRLQETRKIKEAGLSPDKEQEVLQQLLHKETKLLQTIDRLKINANHENKDVRIQHTLGDMAKPKQYELKNGNKVEVHTPFTTRAKELMQLYNGLNLPMLTIDERLDVLLHVKWTVKEFDCNLTREIVSLIDREADLLNRGRNPGMLEGLRKRISSMFLNFIETPEFNPEAARYQVVPMDFERYIFEKLEKSSSPAVTVHTRTSKWDA